MTTARLNPQQREIILEWVRSLSDPFTIEDLAQRFHKHYQTAYTWVRELMNDEVLVQHPMRDGRKNRYMLKDQSPGEAMDLVASAIRVVWGADNMVLSEFALPQHRDQKGAVIGHALFYLFIRSYYADAPNHQHLRGTHPPFDVRNHVVDILRAMKRDVEVIEQLLAYSAPWVEGGEFARRFGPTDGSFGLQEAMGVAKQYESILTKVKDEKRMDVGWSGYTPPVGGADE